MGLQCNNIEALRVALKNGCEEEKPKTPTKPLTQPFSLIS